MTDSDIDGDDVGEERAREGAGSSTGSGGVDSVTPQAEVSGGDPAGFEPSGVGDWDPSSAGGEGGEVY